MPQTPLPHTIRCASIMVDSTRPCVLAHKCSNPAGWSRRYPVTMWVFCTSAAITACRSGTYLACMALFHNRYDPKSNETVWLRSRYRTGERYICTCSSHVARSQCQVRAAAEHLRASCVAFDEDGNDGNVRIQRSKGYICPQQKYTISSSHPLLGYHSHQRLVLAYPYIQTYPRSDPHIVHRRKTKENSQDKIVRPSPQYTYPHAMLDRKPLDVPRYNRRM